MPVTGIHALIYSPQAEELRRVLDDVFGWDQVDAGGGWPIYALPPAELAVHPGEPHHELSLMCDDITGTIAALAAKGVAVQGEPQDRGWGVATTLVFPGGVEMLLYEPRHPSPGRGGA
jgi:hypothetical protein